MYGRLQQPAHLWRFIMTQSFDEIESFTDKLKFDYKQKLDNGLLYNSLGEVLILEFQGNSVKMVTYKTTAETDYMTCISYAKEDLQYKIIIDDLTSDDHVLRLEGEMLILFCRKVFANKSISCSLRLLFKTDIPMGKVNVEVSTL